MKLLLLIAVLLVVSKQDGVNSLQTSDFTQYIWKYSNDETFLGYMTFNSDGTIGTYTGQYETNWSLSASKQLTISSSSGPTCTFVFPVQDYFGKWFLQCRYANPNLINKP